MEDKEKNLHWLQLVYEEAWRQYNHEDNIAEQRDSKYLTILSLVFTAVGVLISILLSFLVEAQTIGNKQLMYAIGILTVICLLLVLILRFSVHWHGVTNAAKSYTAIRLQVAAEIEVQANFPVKMATDQQALLDQQDHHDASFDGFDSTLRIIRTVTVLSACLLSAAVLGIAACIVLMFIL